MALLGRAPVGLEIATPSSSPTPGVLDLDSPLHTPSFEPISLFRNPNPFNGMSSSSPGRRGSDDDYEGRQRIWSREEDDFLKESLDLIHQLPIPPFPGAIPPISALSTLAIHILSTPDSSLDSCRSEDDVTTRLLYLAKTKAAAERPKMQRVGSMDFLAAPEENETGTKGRVLRASTQLQRSSRLFSGSSASGSSSKPSSLSPRLLSSFGGTSLSSIPAIHPLPSSALRYDGPAPPPSLRRSYSNSSSSPSDSGSSSVSMLRRASATGARASLMKRAPSYPSSANSSFNNDMLPPLSTTSSVAASLRKSPSPGPALQLSLGEPLGSSSTTSNSARHIAPRISRSLSSQSGLSGPSIPSLRQKFLQSNAYRQHSNSIALSTDKKPEAVEHVVKKRRTVGSGGGAVPTKIDTSITKDSKGGNDDDDSAALASPFEEKGGALFF